MTVNQNNVLHTAVRYANQQTVCLSNLLLRQSTSGQNWFRFTSVFSTEKHLKGHIIHLTQVVLQTESHCAQHADNLHLFQVDSILTRVETGQGTLCAYKV